MNGGFDSFLSTNNIKKLIKSWELQFWSVQIIQRHLTMSYSDESQGSLGQKLFDIWCEAGGNGPRFVIPFAPT